MNPMIKMLLPSVMSMVQKPEFKHKLICLMNKEKSKYQVRDGEDLRLIISSTADDIIVKVVSMDVLSGKVIDVLGIYRFEELVELLTKLI